MNADQLRKDILTLDEAPYDQPLNDEEQAALDRCQQAEETLGVMRFWETCAELQIPLSKFTAG